ncbi:hypothetical protein DSO57_1008087 [Entomophthora muscae]|uniref:Uncharacterized protein n=1 Tax=Entomophthora muscae TaxID=34485 RepID=A0ACC2RYA3_9FUNG|nr:hypothetical protein DSO57_1008087 [Entomophthora muscae]
MSFTLLLISQVAVGFSLFLIPFLVALKGDRPEPSVSNFEPALGMEETLFDFNSPMFLGTNALWAGNASLFVESHLPGAVFTSRGSQVLCHRSNVTSICEEETSRVWWAPIATLAYSTSACNNTGCSVKVKVPVPQFPTVALASASLPLRDLKLQASPPSHQNSHTTFITNGLKDIYWKPVYLRVFTRPYPNTSLASLSHYNFGVLLPNGLPDGVFLLSDPTL